MKNVWGIYRGVVTETKDPEQRGRLKVRVPAVLGTKALWAEPCVSKPDKSATKAKLPKVNAEIWIQFEGGDTDTPVWMGFPMKK